jgi:hypothetical protein
MPGATRPAYALSGRLVQHLHTVTGIGEQPLAQLPHGNLPVLASPFARGREAYHPRLAVHRGGRRGASLVFDCAMDKTVKHGKGFVDEVFLLRLPDE